MLGTSGLIVYNIGYIILYANVLRQLLKFRALGDKRPLLMYGWIYEKYEAQYCWYESVILVQRYVRPFAPTPVAQCHLSEATQTMRGLPVPGTYITSKACPAT